MFDRKGIILIKKSNDISEDELMEVALEAGAEDFLSEEDGFEIYTDASSLYDVKDVIQERGYDILSAEVSMILKHTLL